MACIFVNANRSVGTINPNIYGQFSEHLGRCIYQGIYVGQASDIPNTNGMRNDVVSALKALHVPVLRWPGGCFDDTYHWRDGIGPKENRKTIVNTNWGGVTEDNSFGTHEFMELCRQIGCEAYFSGNVGSGTVQEFSDWVEYCNMGGISPMASERRANGQDEPFNVKYWGIGNEAWGCGGNMRPEYYADEYRRYQTFNGDPTKGLIIFPCELIFLNGHVLKDCIYKYIELWNLGEDFKKWFTDCCGVYATLVDRIVPGFPRKEIKDIQQKICYEDNLVVQAEIFHLWVIEAPKEIAEEFPADKAGLHVLFVPSEEPYHERKVTLLNGPHTVLSPVAFLSGINIVRDACKDPVVGKYIHKVQFEELMETLNLPKDELQKFASDVLERFMNPFVDHQVTSIMLNSFPKYQTRDLPGVKTYLERKGELPQGLVFGLAAIITYYKGGKREDGTEIVPNDSQEIMDLLKNLWATGDTQKVTDGVLSASQIWGEDLNNIPGLNALVKKDLDLIQEKGMLEAVKTIL